MLGTTIIRDRSRSIPDIAYVRAQADKPAIDLTRTSNKPLPRKASLGEKMRIENKKQQKKGSQQKKGKQGKAKAHLERRGKARLALRKVLASY